MRRTPQSIAVITTAYGQNKETQRAGMTVSSLTSVCVTPVPVISFNIKLPSLTYSTIRKGGYFLAHLLTTSREAAELAQRFTQPGMSDTLNKRSDLALVDLGDHDLPVLPNPVWEALLHCKVLDDEIRVGDHVIVLGEVLKVDEKYKGVTGLLYCNGKYTI
jgi:flavin reductase (DIM6/NTAB) family NADH-FMN oxidoreductase RutF